MLTHGTFRHRRRRVSVGLVIGLALGLLALASHEQGARGAFPGTNARLAYALSGAIWVINPDGTGATKIVDSTTATAPAFSPDGTKIAYVDHGRTQVVSASGGVPSAIGPALSTAAAPGEHPAWSPDATKIAVEGGTSGFATGLQVFRVSDGAVVGQYFPDTTASQAYIYPSWRPVGTTTDIAVERSQGRKGPDAAEIYLIHTSDGSTTNVTNTPNVQEYGQLDWTPDGQRLAFHATCTSQDGCSPDVSKLSSIAATGGSETQLATPVTGEGIAYSPDGTRIAYATGSSVVIANSNGSNPTSLPVAAKGLSWGGPSAPLVTGVSPGSGPIKGGNRITVTGSGFTGAYGVCFIPSGLNYGNPGGCTSAIQIVSDSQIVLTGLDFSTSPVQGASRQTYDVRVQRTANTPTSRSPVTAADQYTAELTVTGLSARSGPIKGGNRITITGTGFTGAYGVCFIPSGLNHGNPGVCQALKAGEVASDTQITLRPAAFIPDQTVASQTYDIVVQLLPSNHTLRSPTSTADQYTAKLAVTGVSPRSGPITGGNPVTITGTGFTGAYGVCFVPSGLNFGNRGGCGTDIHVVSDSKITLSAFDFSAFPQTVSSQTYDLVVQLLPKNKALRSATSAADQYTATLGCIRTTALAADTAPTSHAVARAAFVNTPPPSNVPPGFIIAKPICQPGAAKRPPIDAEKEAKKAYDRGYSQSLSDSSTTNGSVSNTLGALSSVPGPPQAKAVVGGLGKLFGLASAIENDAAKNAATRAKDPPDSHYTRIAAAKPAHLSPALARSLPASIRTRVLLAARLAASAVALSTNATTSINRAASAHAAHRSVWERRQMLATARFSRSLAGVLDREADDLTALRRSTLIARLNAGALTARRLSTLAHSVAAHGLPRSLSQLLHVLGVPAAQQSLLRTQMGSVTAPRGRSITYRALISQALSTTATLLHAYASNLRTYAGQVNRNPVSSNAS